MRMRDIAILAAGSVLSVTNLSVAQTVEFRIVERTGQAALTPTDSTLDFAVQARVVGAPAGVGLRSFGFDVVAKCELDVWGTLNRVLISNADGTYSGFPIAVNNTVGRGGLAAQFAYAAAADPNANGLLNASGGTHVNNVSAQDIGSIRGLAQGTWLVKPLDGDGNTVPDSSPQNAMGAAAPDGSTAVLESTVAQQFFGADGTFVDVYRFRQVVTNLAGCRVIPWTVVVTEPPTVFSQLVKSNGEWTGTPVAATVVSTPLQFITCLGGVQFCRGDYNHDFSVTVPDIFDYINGWFASCVGQSGGTCQGRTVDGDCDGQITIQDLFDFINRWLGPC